MAQGRCVECKALKGVTYSVAAGGLICRKDYRAKYAPRERCGCCNRVDKIISARPDGVAHCEACYKREINCGHCAYCRRKKPVHARDVHHRIVCLECYEAHFKTPEKCMYCHKDKAPAYRSARGKGICRVCYHREVLHDECDACGNDLPIAARTLAGRPLCTHHAYLAKKAS